MSVDLNEYYSNYDEHGRLERDNHHKTEFILTNYWIDKYLKSGMRILEIGAGTGAYSLSFARLGYQVDAVELTEHNLNILKSNISDDMNINTVQGNALDLNMFSDNTFDMVLCLGPLYHLSHTDRKRCINEALRVCKPEGIMFFAYISNNFTFTHAIKKFDNYLSAYSHEFDKNFKILDHEFTMSTPEEMEALMNESEVQKSNHVSTDGISGLIRERINELNEKDFDTWINYLKKTSEDPSLLGYSQHILYIGKKKLTD